MKKGLKLGGGCFRYNWSCNNVGITALMKKGLKLVCAICLAASNCLVGITALMKKGLKLIL